MDIFRPADILLPNVEDMTAWSVVACDQFTSEPEYWQQVRKIAGDKPSALNMILPEAELGIKDTETESEKIYSVMRSYLESGVFTELKDSFLYIERTLSDGTVRPGLVGMLDLEAYDWTEGSVSPIRATEHTVEDRLPPRIRVREKALVEMPHIMVFIDDPEDYVFSSVKKGKLLYDFELMQHGGHIKGWQVSDNAAVEAAVDKLGDKDELIKKYGSADDPIVFAIGDGNHSVAAAKQYWEEIKPMLSTEEREMHPARFALCEINNIHSPAITFEPIHKVLFDTEAEQFISEAKKYFADDIGKGKAITVVTHDMTETIELADMTLGEIIGSCESFCKAYIERFGGRIDYIHGDEECIGMAGKEHDAGILMPRMEKSELFTSVYKSGPFPKKSFSIGHGPDKRYYLECRIINPCHKAENVIK